MVRLSLAGAGSHWAERGSAAATACPGGRAWLSPGWDTCCASVPARRGPGAGRAGSCLEQQGFRQLNTLCPACVHGSASIGKPGRIPHPPFPGGRNKSPPFSEGVLPAFCSTSLWKLPVPGLCFACVLRRGSSSKGFFLLGFAV